jgi:hypothetical protein
MHFIRAYIASIIILASWDMHHLVSIMAIALCHMHHLNRAWNPSSSYCILIPNSASHSWVYISNITLWIGAFYHYPLIASVSIGMFYNQHPLNYLSNKLWAKILQTSFCQTLIPSLFVIHEFRPHVQSLILSNSPMYNLFILSLYSSRHALVINFNLL